MNKHIFFIAIAISSVSFTCEKENNAKNGLPEHVKACMKIKKAQHEYTCRFATPEEEKAIEVSNFNERVAIVRGLMEKNNIPQSAMSDEAASEWYIKEMSKQVLNGCNQQ